MRRQSRPKQRPRIRSRLQQLAVAVVLAGCTSSPLPPPVARFTPSAPIPVAPASRPTPLPDLGISEATSAKDYRLDAATHLYRKNAARIYHGKLPPMLYAVGVLQTDIDRHGGVTRTRWLRPPKHAPEVIAEIEKMVRLTAPYPAPARLGRGHFHRDLVMAQERPVSVCIH